MYCNCYTVSHKFLTFYSLWINLRMRWRGSICFYLVDANETRDGESDAQLSPRCSPSSPRRLFGLSPAASSSSVLPICSVSLSNCASMLSLRRRIIAVTSVSLRLSLSSSISTGADLFSPSAPLLVFRFVPSDSAADRTEVARPFGSSV